MKQICDRILAILFALLSVCWVSVTLADTVSAQNPPENSLGLHSSYFKEAGHGLTISDAITAYDSGKFHSGDTPVLDFGIGSRPVRIQFDVDNRSGASLLRRLSIETSWLDKVDLPDRQARLEHRTAQQAGYFGDRGGYRQVQADQRHPWPRLRR